MRLKIDDLRVMSFVTSLRASEQMQARGGISLHGPACSNNVCEPLETQIRTECVTDYPTNTCVVTQDVLCSSD